MLGPPLNLSIAGVFLGLSLLLFYITVVRKQTFAQFNRGVIVSPRVLILSPKSFFAIRFIYFLWTIPPQIYDYFRSGATELIFFTIWNYHLQSFYFFLLVIFSYNQLFKRPQPDPESLGLLGKTVISLQEVCLTLSILVLVVFWAILVPGSPPSFWEQYYSFCAHLINTVFLSIDFAISRMPMVRAHFSFVLIWTASYGLFAMIYQAAGGRSPYFFLVLDTATTAAWIFGILLIIVAIFFLLCYLMRWKVERDEVAARFELARPTLGPHKTHVDPVLENL